MRDLVTLFVHFLANLVQLLCILQPCAISLGKSIAAACTNSPGLRECEFATDGINCWRSRVSKSKLSVVVACAVFVTGCASSVPYKIADTPVAPVVPGWIEDNRPAVETEGGLPLLFNPTYTVPDARFDPPLLALFGHQTVQELGTMAAQHRIVVNRLRVQNYFGETYNNNQAASMASTAAVSGNTTIATVMNEIRDGAAVDAVIVEIEASIDGKSFKGAGVMRYSATPPMTYLGMSYDLPESRIATREAVEMAIRDAMINMRKAMDRQ